ncbi:MAG: c-type cytochrome biogenesis protein CcmI [Rhodobacteraceae bacterium]|nr:c-type cytochrome biogenesis protein CcmI [Paracoccaceae bacterium]
MFWMIICALALIVCAPLALALTHDSDDPGAAAKDIAVYKDQLKEINRDLARGTLAKAEAEAARTEIARRLLAADKRAGAETAARASGPRVRAAGFVIIAVVALGGGALYRGFGAPDYQDMPMQDRLDAVRERNENRPRQARAEALIPPVPPIEAGERPGTLLKQLRTTVEDRPGDTQGLRLLAGTEMRMGNFKAAHRAQARLIEALGDAAGAEDWTDLAEYMISAAAGYVSPEAEAALTAALRADPRNPRARYYSGLMLAQAGRPDRAYRVWANLLQESTPTDPWVPPIRSQIHRVALAAGIPLTSPALHGPDAPDITAAENMDAEDRQKMIRGMISGLAGRLTTEGGTAAEWARLIRAYGVLGERARASEIWHEARAAFAGDPVSLALLREAAQAAEVAQ